VAALSDESLLAGMAAGESTAATAFVRRYQARVYGLARTVVGSSALAEDVAQEVFLKAWRHASAYDARRGPVASWLLTITRNAAIDAVRYRREVPTDPDVLIGALAGRSSDLDRPGSAVETADELRQALRELPREQSTPLVLMVFYGLTAKEVAARDGIPVGTVKTRVRRAFSVLRQRLGVRDD
jgi:RNA polymerase sigma-70 factor (ECF subfamily)